jgi:hypothetical protein
MGKKGRRNNEGYLAEELQKNPDIAAKIDHTKPGWKQHAKKLLSENYNGKVDLSKPAALGPKDYKKFIKKMTKEAVQKRIAEIKAKQEANATTPEVVDTPVSNIVDVVAEKSE